jgi:hypothetical protein
MQSSETHILALPMRKKAGCKAAKRCFLAYSEPENTESGLPEGNKTEMEFRRKA